MRRRLTCGLLFFCVAAGGEAFAAPAVQCYQLAADAGGLRLGATSALRLCGGAASAQGPIKCYRQAISRKGLALTAPNATTLCRRAPSASGPARCFSQAFSGGLRLSLRNALALCSHD